MKGILFEGHEVEIDPRTPTLGGSFLPKGVKRGAAYAYDRRLIKFVFERLEAIPAMTFADVGANTGSFSMLAKFLLVLRVYAFEPNSAVYATLNRNLKLNSLTSRVWTYPCALAGKRSRGILHIPSKNGMSGHSTLGAKPSFRIGNQYPVDLRTLDGIAKQLDFIKTDTEGCDLFVLQGAKRILEAHHPEIVFERNAKAMAQFNLKVGVVEEYLRSVGYTKFKPVGAEDVWAT